MLILSFDVGIINLAYCIFDTTTTKILHWEIIELAAKNFSNFSGKVPSGNKFIASAANDIHINLIKALDSRPFLLNVDIVIIEKQPSFNPKMRIIGGCLQSYFYIRGVIDNKSISSVEFFSPKHKLKCYTGPPIVVNAKGKYAQTKKMGIIIAESKLKEYSERPEIIKIYTDSKKKDDLSDCYLQALTYSIFKKFIKSSNVTQVPLVPLVPVVKETKVVLKQKFKDFLDSKIDPSGSIIENLIIPDELNKSLKTKYTFNDISELLSQMNLKRYQTLTFC
jgi:hypothetical protein